MRGILVVSSRDLARCLSIRRAGSLNRGCLRGVVGRGRLRHRMLLSRYSSRLFLLGARGLRRPLFRVLVRRLNRLVASSRRQRVFLSISNNRPVTQITGHGGVACTQITAYCDSVLQALNRRGKQVTAFHDQAVRLVFSGYGTIAPMGAPLSGLINTRTCGILSLSTGARASDYRRESLR